MAVILKKKQVEVTPAPQEEISQRQLDALEAVGLAPEKKTGFKGITIKKKVTSFDKGARVQIVNDKFPWMEAYKHGDMGVIQRHWAAPESPHTKRPRDDIYEVLLDKARVPKKPVVLVALWELALAPVA